MNTKLYKINTASEEQITIATLKIITIVTAVQSI